MPLKDQSTKHLLSDPALGERTRQALKRIIDAVSLLETVTVTNGVDGTSLALPQALGPFDSPTFNELHLGIPTVIGVSGLPTTEVDPTKIALVEGNAVSPVTTRYYNTPMLYLERWDNSNPSGVQSSNVGNSKNAPMLLLEGRMMGSGGGVPGLTVRQKAFAAPGDFANDGMVAGYFAVDCESGGNNRHAWCLNLVAAWNIGNSPENLCGIETDLAPNAGNSRKPLPGEALSDAFAAYWAQSGGGDAQVTGTASAGGASTLTDASKAFTVNEHALKYLYITGGTGAGQSREIISNTATVLTVAIAWITNPDATSTYTIRRGGISTTGLLVRSATIYNKWRYGIVLDSYFTETAIKVRQNEASALGHHIELLYGATRVFNIQNEGYVGIGVATGSIVRRQLELHGNNINLGGLLISGSGEAITAVTSSTNPSSARNGMLQSGYDTTNDKGFIRSVKWGSAFQPLYAQAEEIRFGLGTVALTECMRFDQGVTFSRIWAISSTVSCQVVSNGATGVALTGAGSNHDYALIVNGQIKARLYTDNNVSLNATGAEPATTATAGFTYLPTCNGVPTGVPSLLPTGAAPVILDRVNNRLYAYLGGAWRIL